MWQPDQWKYKRKAWENVGGSRIGTWGNPSISITFHFVPEHQIGRLGLDQEPHLACQPAAMKSHKPNEFQSSAKGHLFRKLGKAEYYWFSPE